MKISETPEEFYKHLEYRQMVTEAYLSFLPELLEKLDEDFCPKIPDLDDEHLQVLSESIDTLRRGLTQSAERLREA